MKNVITFFPIGNADCTLIRTSNTTVIIDYCHRDTNVFCLEGSIRHSFNIKHVDYLIVTHIDDDHVKGIENVFNLRNSESSSHAKKITVGCLVVSAATVLEKGLSSGSGKKVRDAARHRLREGHKDSIMVISSPSSLDAYLNLSLEQKKRYDDFFIFEDKARRIDLFEQLRSVTIEHGSNVNLGSEVNALFLNPSTYHFEEIDSSRNENSIAVNFTLSCDQGTTKFLTFSDCNASTIEDILERETFLENKVSRYGDFECDILKTPHHCSYKSLNCDSGAKYEVPTQPYELIHGLYSHLDKTGLAYIISSSKYDEHIHSVEPVEFHEEQESSLWDGPPNRQASLYYGGFANSEHIHLFENARQNRCPVPVVYDMSVQVIVRTKHYELIEEKFKCNYHSRYNDLNIKCVHPGSGDFVSHEVTVDKSMTLTFRIHTLDDFFKKDDNTLIYWQITNFGPDAEKGDLRGEIKLHNKTYKEEPTAYVGQHWVEAFIVNKDSVCVGRTGTFLVNVQDWSVHLKRSF